MINRRVASVGQVEQVQYIIPEAYPGGGAVLVLRDGESYRMILKVTPINIDHVDDGELAVRLVAWGKFLDSLGSDFPIQIMIHAKQLNPETYFRQFTVHLNSPETPDDIKWNIKDHLQYVTEMIRENNQLDRETYLIIPFGPVDAPTGDSLTDAIPVMKVAEGASRAVTDFMSSPPTMEGMEQARKQLELRLNHVQTGISRFGCSARPLNEQEVQALLYEQYRSQQAERQRSQLIGNE